MLLFGLCLIPLSSNQLSGCLGDMLAQGQGLSLVPGDCLVVPRWGLGLLKDGSKLILDPGQIKAE